MKLKVQKNTSFGFEKTESAGWNLLCLHKLREIKPIHERAFLEVEAIGYPRWKKSWSKASLSQLATLWDKELLQQATHSINLQSGQEEENMAVR